MKRWQWALLIFELVLFALILVLPQVELPEFAFQRGTAPIVAKARLSFTPVHAAVTLQHQILIPGSILESLGEASLVLSSARSQTRLSLLCTLIC